jgi:hypothetical protein
MAHQQRFSQKKGYENPYRADVARDRRVDRVGPPDLPEKYKPVS